MTSSHYPNERKQFLIPQTSGKTQLSDKLVNIELLNLKQTAKSDDPVLEQFITPPFSVGVFEEKARLLQWLVFSSVECDRSTICA